MDAEEEDKNNDGDDQSEDAEDDTTPQGTEAEESNQPENVKEQLSVEGDERVTSLTSPLDVALLAEALPLEQDESRSATNQEVDDDPDKEPDPSRGGPPRTIHQAVQSRSITIVDSNLGTSKVTGSGGSGRSRGSVVSRVIEQLRVADAKGEESPENGNKEQDGRDDPRAAKLVLAEEGARPVALLEGLANVALAALVVTALVFGHG